MVYIRHNINHISDKMVSELSAQHACGQIIFSLKNSNLNYLVKETPYSAYITIRKKYIKEIGVNDVPNSFKENETDTKIKELLEENGELKRENALQLFDFEELEVKFEALTKEKQSLEDQVDNLYEVKRKATNELEKVAKENDELKKEAQKVKDIKVKANLDKKELKDKTDLVEILEQTLENKTSEIESLKKLNAQLDKKDVIVKRYDTCKICSFDKGVDLRKHVEENHTHKCLECEDVLFTKDRLESHIRIYHIWDCDLCDFTADTGENLEEHKVTCHEHECYYCDFETTDAKDLTRHIEEDHSNKCPCCDITFKTKEKFNTHICKVHISNPTFKSLYTRSWYDANGCNPVYCSQQNQDILWLHSKTCRTMVVKVIEKHGIEE